MQCLIINNTLRVSALVASDVTERVIECINTARQAAQAINSTIFAVEFDPATVNEIGGKIIVFGTARGEKIQENGFPPLTGTICNTEKFIFRTGVAIK